MGITSAAVGLDKSGYTPEIPEIFLSNYEKVKIIFLMYIVYFFTPIAFIFLGNNYFIIKMLKLIKIYIY